VEFAELGLGGCWANGLPGAALDFRPQGVSSARGDMSASPSGAHGLFAVEFERLT
jgi:hypothetical protein